MVLRSRQSFKETIESVFIYSLWVASNRNVDPPIEFLPRNSIQDDKLDIYKQV